MPFKLIRMPILWLALCLLTNNTPVQGQPLRRDLVGLFNTTAAPRAIGERCSSRRPCEEGLTCTLAPSCIGGLVPQKKCFPVDCIGRAVLDLDKRVNITGYQDSMFARAGVTPEEFFMMDKSRNVRPLTALSTVQEMRESPKVHKVMQAIRENPIPQDTWENYESALQACDPENKLSQKNSFGFGPTTPGVLGAIGVGADVGAGLGGGIEFFFAFPSDGPFFFIDLGGGLLFGVDAGVSSFAGLIFTGTPEDVPGVGFELSLQIPTPIVGPGMSLGLSIDGVWDLALTINLGAGIGIGGFSAGYTWGFPNAPNSTTFN